MTDIENTVTMSDDENSSYSNSEMEFDSIETKSNSSNLHHQNNNINIINYNNNNNNDTTNKSYVLHHHRSMKDNSINSSVATLSPSSPSSSSSSRRNKRKNFKPRNIHEYEGSEEEGLESHQHRHNNSNSNATKHYQMHHDLSQRPNNNNNKYVVDKKHSLLLPSSDSLRQESLLRINHNNIARDSRSEDNNESSDSDNGPDIPLDLSEVQNDSLSKQRKSRVESTSSSSEPQNDFNSLHSQLPHHLLHPSSLPYFNPMDLRLLANHSHHVPTLDQRSNEFDNVSSTNYPTVHKNNYNSPDMFSSANSSNSGYSASALTDFAQSTMKELLGLYGIAENLRQAGGVAAVGGKTTSSMDIRNYDLSLTSDSSSRKLESSKIILPENMARFLAAVHESVNMVNNSGGNTLIPNSSSNNNITQNSSSSPLNFTKPSSILETAQSSSTFNGNEAAGRCDLKSQLHLNNINNNANNHNQHNNGANSSNKTPGHSYIQTNSSNSSTNNNITSNYMNTRSTKRRNDSPTFERSNNNQNELNHSQNINEAELNKGMKQPKTIPTSGKSCSGFDPSLFPVIREGLLGKGSGPVDYTKYVKRYENCSECGYQHCQDLNYKEHFHCLQCCEGARVFIKKDEMIRHFKWHKKRDESLQHGFMRYSSSDNCNDRFSDCPHNRKQTHYHCIHDGCVKVYVSTSDVQMHSNYHRKDSAIIQEGFQRFRATEDCRGDHCGFRRQHTTHFHCRRDGCLYTFKNKADMEKHKAYHVKGEQMCKDGFKKFMKHENCNFPTCRFSRVCNHIHCIRDGCNYVLHSSGQLYSHKRKHERRDAELAYRRFKLAQSITRGSIIGTDLSSMSWSDSIHNKSDDDENSHHSSSHVNGDADEGSEKLIEQCSKCEVSEEEHFHCQAESCRNALLGTPEEVSEHTRSHELEDRISSLAYFTVDPANFDAQDSTIPCVSAKCAYQNSEKHYHCLWGECTEIILPTDEPFKRLEHFKSHEFQKLDIMPTNNERQEGDNNINTDGFFKRKRGRPLKNRTIEVPGSNESVFTSFKLPKPSIPGSSPDYDTQYKDPIGFTSYHAKSKCPDIKCQFNASSPSHYHCAHPRCHFAVKDVHKLSLHLRDFHSNVDILDGYEYFERSIECHKSKCEYNGINNHFHCTRDDYVFQRYSSMAVHEAEVHDSKSDRETCSSDEEENIRVQQIPTKSHEYLNANEKGSNGTHPMDLSALSNSDSIDLKSISDHSLSRILQLPETSETHFGPDCACGRPFCKLKRKYHFHCHLCNQAFSEIEKLRPHILKHNNLSVSSSSESEMKSNSLLRSSCEQTTELSIRKVAKDDDKNRDNNNPSIPSQLDLSTTTIPTTLSHPSVLSNFLGYPTSHSPYLFLQQNPFSSLYAGMMFGQNFMPNPEMMSSQLPTSSTSSTPPSKSLLLPTIESHLDTLSPLSIPNPSTLTMTPLKRPPSNSSSPASPPSECKKQRMQLRILKDEPVPEGYVRFRFNEDCTYVHCGYREHQTHFHCIREDCGYSFCDKTRFVQHTARHDRLDSLMGGDFKQYRANVACGREDCTYIPTTSTTGTNAQGQQNKASHFHCCKCDYVCTDTNKVVAHRRQHQKMDSITAAGFEKYTPSQLCNDESCIHVQKQTHYHCIKCNFSVLGLSQMSAHKYRHDDESSSS